MICLKKQRKYFNYLGNNSEFVIKAQLLAYRSGNYTTYVFQNLDEGEYIMCTKLPNWDTPNIDIDEIGYLKYRIVRAGEKYYNSEINMIDKYKYDAIYFDNFVKDSNIKNKEIIL